MEFIKRSILTDSEKQEVFELWNNEYPVKLSYKSLDEFEEYLRKLTDKSHILVIDSVGTVKGWYIDFTRDNEKWFAIILDSKIQGKGLGTKLLKLAKQKESELNGWVIDHSRDKKKNGEIYNSPLSFYQKNGFEKLIPDRLELDKISAVRIKWTKQKTGYKNGNI